MFNSVYTSKMSPKTSRIFNGLLMDKYTGYTLLPSLFLVFLLFNRSFADSLVPKCNPGSSAANLVNFLKSFFIVVP